MPRSEWVLTPKAFQPIVEASVFSEAQRILLERTFNKSDGQLLDALRALLAAKGRLSRHLIQDSVEVPSASTYVYRFGSLQRTYERIGYGHPKDFAPSVDLRRRTQAMRDELIASIASMFPDDVSIFRPGGKWRTRLKLRNELIVSVLIGRPIHRKSMIRWRIEPIKLECNCVTLLARLDYDHLSFMDFHILPSVDRRHRFFLSLTDKWLDRGQPLTNLLFFCKTASLIAVAERR
jgi:hypothetical protein